MKKLVFTLAALVTLSLTTNAQTEPKKAETKSGTSTKTEAAKPNGTTTDGKTTTTTEEPKKTGTRMAINEKGLPGDKKPKKTTAASPK